MGYNKWIWLLTLTHHQGIILACLVPIQLACWELRGAVQSWESKWYPGEMDGESSFLDPSWVVTWLRNPSPLGLSFLTSKGGAWAWPAWFLLAPIFHTSDGFVILKIHFYSDKKGNSQGLNKKWHFLCGLLQSWWDPHRIMWSISYCFCKFTFLKSKTVIASAAWFVKVTKAVGMMPEF